MTLDAALGHLPAAGRLRLLVAEEVTNVDNMGALFRNAAAFDASGIVLDPRCCDPLYRKAIRVSMGHTLSVPYAVADPWPDELERLKREWGLAIVGAETGDDARPLWALPRDDRMALVFGSERHGLSAAVRDVCDTLVEIPMSAEVPSLNVAVASAVCLYELARDPSPRR